MRIKNHWFRDSAGKAPAEHASAMAFIVWRVAKNMLDRMRGARFDVDAGPVYFAFMREVLVFLIQVTDRMAFRQMAAPERMEFTTALVLRVADILAGNEDDLLGPPDAGAPTHRDRFIDLVNQLADHYAEFGADPTTATFTPDFAFMRYLGARIAPLVPLKDQRWVLDQVMAIEAPDAVEIVQRGMQGLFCAEPPARRRSGSMSGD